MIRSMTGFGRAQVSVEGYNITVEIRSVNHRYFEFYAKMPRAYSFLEEKVKALLSTGISRGKVECSIQLEATADESVVVSVNEPLAKGYVDAVRQIADTFNLPDDMTAFTVARFSDVLSVSKAPVDEDALWSKVEPVVKAALAEFVAMRETEGERLLNDVLSRAHTILEKVALVEAESPETVKAYRERLEQKMRELLDSANIDEQRLITETAIFADKIAVDEETVRLRSHIKQLESFFEAEGPVGKKLDFLIQEMNRETNTIGSKSQNTKIAYIVVDIKSEIEKIREQIQNIE